jgi:hypothetical protein
MGRFTWVLAGVFMLTSLLLTMISPWGEKGLHAEPTGLHGETTTLPPLGEEAVPAPVPEDLAAPASSEAAAPGDAEPAPLEAPTPAEPTAPAPTTPDS